MIVPSQKKIKKLVKKKKINLPEKENYFSLADEYVKLSRIFNPEDILDKINIWIDMIFYPIYVFVQLVMGQFSVFHILGVQKSVTLWIDWFRFRTLKTKVKSWTVIVKNLGGPWISANDAEYHVYVYADAMERISTSSPPPPSRKGEGSGDGVRPR